MISLFVILLGSFIMYKHTSASTEFILPTYVACFIALMVFVTEYRKYYTLDFIQLINTAGIMNLIMSFLFSPTYINSFICRMLYNISLGYVVGRHVQSGKI
jgi:hypothetical protein